MSRDILYVSAPVTDIREKPDAEALRGKLESQLVFGEKFVVEENHGDWVKGYGDHDRYAGFVQKQDLTKVSKLATHMIIDARADIYKDKTIKSPLLQTLSFGSRVTVTGQEGNFSKLADGRYIYSKHLTTLGTQEKDYAATALKFLETPYKWGGRSGFGIDCSGLVQVCLALAGIPCPRDTEQQISTIGKDTPPTSDLRRGDIVFFPGHVGIMQNETHIIHANAHHMKVTCEQLHDVVKRSEKITQVKRIAP